MKLYVRLFPIEQGAEFPFTVVFQRYMHAELSQFVVPSEWFTGKYGSDWELIFNLSSRWSLESFETRGPTVFRKDKDVEYSIFLPFRVVIESKEPPQTALDLLFEGMLEILEKMQIDTSRLRAEQVRIVTHIRSEPKMFKINPNPESGIGPPVWSVMPKN